MVKKLSAFLLIAACCCFSMGETATVRTIFKDGRKISKSVKLEDVSESVKRLTVPKSELSGDVRFIDVVADRFALLQIGKDIETEKLETVFVRSGQLRNIAVDLRHSAADQTAIGQKV